MASVTYTFVNGNLADADEVNQNFTDLIDEFDTTTGHDHDGSNSTGTINPTTVNATNLIASTKLSFANFLKASDVSAGSNNTNSWVQIGSASVAAGAVSNFIIVAVVLNSDTEGMTSVQTSRTEYDILIGESGSETSKETDTHLYQMPSGAGGSDRIEMTSTIIFYYEPTSDEKTNGFDVDINGRYQGNKGTIECKYLYVFGA